MFNVDTGHDRPARRLFSSQRICLHALQGERHVWEKPITGEHRSCDGTYLSRVKVYRDSDRG